MVTSAKRHAHLERDAGGSADTLADALVRSSRAALFALDGDARVVAPVSPSFAALFRREAHADLTFEQLLAPLVPAATLGLACRHVADLGRGDVVASNAEANPLRHVEVRLPKSGGFDAATLSFEFVALEPVAGDLTALDGRPAAGRWLVRVEDVTATVHAVREIEDLQAQLRTQGEILRGVLHLGGTRFAAFLKRTDDSMNAINAVLKKPAREERAFRQKLEEILEEVDRIRRDGVAFRLSALEGAARQFEDALHELRGRAALSGGDFLPLAVKLDQLYGQYALLKLLTASAGPAGSADRMPAVGSTDNGTQIIRAPRFDPSAPGVSSPGASSPVATPATTVAGAAGTPPPAAGEPAAEVAAPARKPVPVATPRAAAPAGSLESALQSLTEHIAAANDKSVVLTCQGLERVPPAHQAAVKNVAIQLIRNAVMHGIESPELRTRSGKPLQGTLGLSIVDAADGGIELSFEDDGAGIDPARVRATAVARGVIDAQGAERMSDRDVLKLIFKSAYTTFDIPPQDRGHGTGLALVRRYVHQAGGKIALASVPGQETLFKVVLPPAPAADATPANA